MKVKASYESHLGLARDALARFLTQHPEHKPNPSLHINYLEGYAAALEAFNRADAYADPATYTTTPEGTDGFKLGYEAAIRSLGEAV